MHRLAFASASGFVALVALVACGNAAKSGGIGNQPKGGGGKPNPAAVVFISAAGGVMEMGCWDPAVGKITGVDECGERAAAMVDGKQVVRADDGARYQLTGRVSDECDASGATMVASIAREGGEIESGHRFRIAVAPPEVDVRFETVLAPFDDELAPAKGRQPADVAARLAAIATADFVASEAGDPARVIAPGEVKVIQAFDVDLDGDGADDRVISAVVEGGSYAGYLWSGVVLFPGIRTDAAVRVWHSDLERMTFDGTFDLDGDGARELVYAAEYYEGAGVGIARIVDGGLVVIGSYGCGA